VKVLECADLLEQDSNADRPSQEWASDNNFIWTDESWHTWWPCLNFIHGGRLAGTSHGNAGARCPIMTLWRRKMLKDVPAHTDCSAVYSMGKKVDCYDNGTMESWGHSFYFETVHGERFKTRSDAKHHVLEYIEVYYNRKQLELS